MNRLGILSIMLLGAACSPQASFNNANMLNPDSGIISGYKVNKNTMAFKATVKIHFETGHCTGVLLDRTTVLTAAHCLDMSGAPKKVEVFYSNKLAKCREFEVSAFEFAPGAVMHSLVHEPDIALLKLATPVCYSVAVELGAQPQENDLLKTAGYGIGTSENQLEHVELEIAPQNRETVLELLYGPNNKDSIYKEEIKQISSYLDLLGNSYIKAIPTTTGQSICHGDSGGPTYREKDGILEIIGINGAIIPHSYMGTPLCGMAYLQLFTPVAPYADWIKSRMDKVNTKSNYFNHPLFPLIN